MTLFLHAAATLLAIGVDNGVGVTPPMGWRHWKAFAAHIDQTILSNMADELVVQRDVDGVPTSLADLGYIYVGLDDHWQNCTRTCANGTVIPSWHEVHDYDYENCVGPGNHAAPGKTNNTGSTVPPWHAADGTPLIDLHRFPDVKGMVDRMHGMGLRSGWYFGNYQCRDAMGRGPYSNGSKWDLAAVAHGAVAAIAKFGFDSVKLDSGFPVGSNLSLWNDLINATGRPVMVENCHQGADAPGLVKDASNTHNCSGLSDVSDCPFNFWRTTGDPEPGWGTIMRELNSLRKVPNAAYPSAKRSGAPEFNADPPRSRPGGWAYPGTMVVGDGSMTYNENAVHFGGWCIVSSPMILAFNLSDPARRDLVWPIITNKEAIQVNQAWAGHPGSQVIAGAGNNSMVEVWTKPLGGDRTAVFIINTEDDNVEAEAQAAAESKVRDLNPWTHLSLIECNASRWSQKFMLSPGATIDNSAVTNVNSTAGKGCWEISACKTSHHAEVGVSGTCKKVPQNCENLCNCNGAWSFNSNGTITSVMDGKCLTTMGPSTGPNAVVVDDCLDPPSALQLWKSATTSDGNTTVAQADGSGCVDMFPYPEPPRPSAQGVGASITIKLSDLKLGAATGTANVKTRDVWEKKWRANSNKGTFTTEIPRHGSVFLIMMPAADTTWPLKFELAQWMTTPVTNGTG